MQDIQHESTFGTQSEVDRLKHEANLLYDMADALLEQIIKMRLGSLRRLRGEEKYDMTKEQVIKYLETEIMITKSRKESLKKAWRRINGSN